MAAAHSRSGAPRPTALRPRHIARLRQLLLVLAVLPLSCAIVAQPAWHFSGVERFVAVADIHGAYAAFETILRDTGLIDDAANWSGGADHLVVVGDVLDRGPDSRRALDLIMALEQQAGDAGGGVHLVLGNHELMNLTGDLRYVAPGEYAAFAEDETPQMRGSAIERLMNDTAGNDTGDELRAAFDARYPPGFFAHREAFSPSGTYGSWLLEQPFLVVIDDWAFVHGGLSGASGDLLPEALNQRLGQELRDYAAALDALTDAGVLGVTDEFNDHPALLAAYAERVRAGTASWPDGAEAAARTVIELNTSFAFDAASPTWYRGNVACSALVAGDRLATLLAAAGAGHLVVGHTPTGDAAIHSRFGGQLYRIDTGMLSDYYGGRPAALVVDGGAVSAVYPGRETVEISPDARGAGPLPAGLSFEQFREFLATADVVGQEPIDRDRSRVLLRGGDIEIEAIFGRNPSRNFVPELAAWHIDRLLGLDMVPVTVARELDGEAGTLQYLAAGTFSETERQTDNIGIAPWCPAGDQYGAMYVFDALIGNVGRTSDRILYSPDNFQVLLVGHADSFPTSRTLPAHLRDLDLPLTQIWSERLRALTEADLERELGGLLDRRRIRALLDRRDEILTGMP